MAELRWNPLLGTWTMVSPNRQSRPNIENEGCPFCPGSGKVPSGYDVLSYDNDFPALSRDVSFDTLGVEPGKEPCLYATAPAYGKCEVILYSPDHDAALWNLSVDHVVRLADLWRNRFCELSQDDKIKYVFIFENRGSEVGVTIHHPHGQIYAYPFIPLKIQVELENTKRYYDQKGKCLICQLNDLERHDKTRIIHENQDFVAYLPFFTDYPYGVFIVPKRHVASILGFTPEEMVSLAAILRDTVGAFDFLFGKLFPYMMCVHQTPVNSPETAGAEEYYHFHIEFYPPLRAEDRIKYYASSEMGAWAACNPLAVEDTAVALREALKRFRREESTNEKRSSPAKEETKPRSEP